MRAACFWKKAGALLCLGLFFASCKGPVEEKQAVDPVERARHYLLSQQGEDGGWHSQVYKDMGQGPELSPFVLKALSYSGAIKEDLKGAQDYLSGQTPQTQGLIYPVYTSSGILLNRLDKEGKWREFLLSFQAQEKLGWTPKDLSYGGWSYAMQPPVKAKDGPIPTLSQANLPSTLFALGGLSLSAQGIPEEAQKRARVFLERCQNYPKGDGGFFASPTDESMNKAAESRSYGSATSDGLRALLLCGYKLEEERVIAAREWLDKHLSSTLHPGDFPQGRYYDRDSLYFYYLWSTAHALGALQRAGAELTPQEKAWFQEVERELISLQKEDGSWSNTASATREDEALVATPMALAVLVLARQHSLTRATKSPGQ